MAKIDEGMIEEIQACIPKKNANACIDKILAEHNIEPDEKANVLLQVMKSKEGEHGGKKDQ